MAPVAISQHVKAGLHCSAPMLARYEVGNEGCNKQIWNNSFYGADNPIRRVLTRSIYIYITESFTAYDHERPIRWKWKAKSSRLQNRRHFFGATRNARWMDTAERRNGVGLIFQVDAPWKLYVPPLNL